MPSMLLAYNAAGEVIATLDKLVLHDAEGRVRGQADFVAVERDGLALTDIWMVKDAAGSGTWPEWIGTSAHDFRVELAQSGTRPKITALIHKESAHRRERSAIEAAAAPALAALVAADGAAAQEAARRALVAVLGHPGRSLLLDATGRTVARPTPPERPALPLLAGSDALAAAIRRE